MDEWYGPFGLPIFRDYRDEDGMWRIEVKSLRGLYDSFMLALLKTESVPVATAAACSFFRYAKLVTKPSGETCVKIIQNNVVVETLPVCLKEMDPTTSPSTQECTLSCPSHSNL